MKEFNHSTLRKAIEQLPQYEPQEQLWDAIEQELNEGEANVHLAKAIDQLPTYDAPDFVWDRIEEGLGEVEAEQVVQLPPRRRLTRVLAIAASICLLLTAGWFSMQQGGQGELSYSEELVFEPFEFDGTADDEEAFAMIEAFCKDGLLVCKDFEFASLKADLDELTESVQYMKTMLNENSTDQYLLAKLTEIELERTGILKQLLQKI